MDRISGKLTVFFEDPFWVGVFEIICHNNHKYNNKYYVYAVIKLS